MLQVTREINGIGAIELRRGIFEVILDEGNAATIEWHSTIQIPIGPGQHTLRIRKHRYHSRTLTFAVGEGDTFAFTCHGVNLWPTWLLSFAVPTLGLSLHSQ